MTDRTIPVLAAPHFDPGTDRVDISLPMGLTVAEIVGMALPGATAAELARCRVALVTNAGAMIVSPSRWHSIRPKPGVQVVIRIVPGKNALRAVLSIVVSIAAVALGTMFGPAVGGLLGLPAGAAAAVGSSLVALGVTVLGNLLINALVPPVKPDTEKARSSYSISGWRNRLDPDGAVPVLLGQIRFAPPFAAMTYTEIVGDWQYIRSLFVFGEGEHEFSDFRIGETAISEYDEVDMEVRTGLEGDAPVSLYPRQVLEESIGVALTRPLPRDDLGEVVDGPAEETPVVRTTGQDASSASVILAWPEGLVEYSEDAKRRSRSVQIRIEHRLGTEGTWQLVRELNVTAKKTEAFYRQHSWNFPSRGRWQIRLTMLTDESDDDKVRQRTVWAALQTVRPEYPIAYDRPLALVAVRIKATHQLNGALDNFSAMGKRICLDWDSDTQTWVKRATSNPASLYRFVLQSSANPKPTPDSGIDLAQLQDWHEFCRLNDLQYNRVPDQAGTSLRDVLTEVAAVGRATPRHDGLRWGVIIDRQGGLIVDHINPRNSWNFSMSRSYSEHPDGLVVKFQDETNDYKPTQRVVPWPGHVGPIDLTETFELPGITDPDIIYREAIRRMHEVMHRPDVYEVTQDGAARVATRGDVVMLSHYVLSSVQRVGRVRAVMGSMIELDEQVSIKAGKTYGIRFRRITEQDVIGQSVVRNISAEPGETEILTLDGTGEMPEAGDLVHFGEVDRESLKLIVTAVEATEDMCSILRMVDAAPEIDQLTDATQIPAWSGRVGEEIDDNLLQPAAPRFASIVSGTAGTGVADQIEYLIEPGSSPISVMQYRVEHRLSGAGSWTSVTIPAANGGGEITGYGQGDIVELRAVGISLADVEGPYSAIVPITVGADDAGIPAALDAEAIDVTTLLGGALVQFATGEDANLTQVQLYRSQSATLNRETDAVGAPVAVSPQQSYSVTTGDTTRSNLLNSGAWTADPGWSVTGDSATHTAGTADSLSQPLNAQADRWYRIGVTVSGRTAGTVTPQLSGGAVQAGTALDADGDHSDRIQAVSGNIQFDLVASSDFDGTVSSISLHTESTAELDAGTHFLWLEPQNEDGVPGPISGPFTIEVI